MGLLFIFKKLTVIFYNVTKRVRCDGIFNKIKKSLLLSVPEKVFWKSVRSNTVCSYDQKLK